MGPVPRVYDPSVCVLPFPASRGTSTAVGIAVGFGILAILFTIGILQFCYKYKFKDCTKCCKKKSEWISQLKCIKKYIHSFSFNYFGFLCRLS